MSLAAISLAALLIALIVSCVSTVHVGFLAIVFAWIVGVYIGGMPVNDVFAGFPTGTFLTLVGITLLFAQAQVNGTLDRIAHRAVGLCRGVTGAIPVMFFVLTAALSSIGAGNIASTALMAPMGMAAAGRYGISPFLMAIMIANGASAGSLSPVTPTGVIVNDIAMRIGLGDVRLNVYLSNLLATAAVAFAGYFLFGGLKLFSGPPEGGHSIEPERPASLESERPASLESERPASAGPDDAFTWKQWLTVAAIVTLIVSVIFFNVNVGMGAFALAMVLMVANAADTTQTYRAIPWSVIMMVSGVTVLVALLERTGGMQLFAGFLASLSTPATVTAVTSFFTGLISIYSSTTGVVLPAFLPTIPGLIEQLGGGDALAIMSSMNVGGHLVDVSPLSTLGALCLAAAPPGTDARALFNKLLAWGISMTVVGALVCWVFFGLL